MSYIHGMPEQQVEILNFVRSEFAKLRLRNPAFSLRAFARQSGVSVAMLSGLFSGKLPLTQKTATKIFSRIKADPKRKQEMLEHLKSASGRRGEPARASTSESEFSLLDMDHYHLIADWFYFGVLLLAETAGFRGNSAWIAKRLRTTRRNAERALTRLERLRLLVRDEEGQIVTSGQHFRTTTQTPNEWLRFGHIQVLDLARASMERDPLEACDFTAMTMAIDPAKIPEAKRMITDFRRRLCVFLESGAKKEVYRLSIQLFPLSNPISAVKPRARAKLKEEVL